MQNNNINEIIKKWGNTHTYKEYKSKTSSYSNSKWNDINNGFIKIFEEFSIFAKKQLPITDLEVIKLVSKLQNYITNYYYTCTDEILLSLSNMYINDERFTKNIDQFGVGTAKYVSLAIKSYIKNKKNEESN